MNVGRTYGGGGRHGRPEWPGGRPIPDVILLVAVLFATFALQFFEGTAGVLTLLRLTPAAWRSGFAWQLVTYAFIGFGGPSPWILLEMLVLYWFAQDVRIRLRGPRFWGVVLSSVAVGAVAASVVQAAATAVAGGSPTALPFQLMQGQRVLLAVLIAAFATLAGDATILLFFVLPVRARWCVWLGILVAFVAYLGSKDLAGFAGICAATGIAVVVTSRRPVGGGFRKRWLEWRRRRLSVKLDRLAKKRGLRVIRRDDGPGGPVVN